MLLEVYCLQARRRRMPVWTVLYIGRISTPSAVLFLPIKRQKLASLWKRSEHISISDVRYRQNGWHQRCRSLAKEPCCGESTGHLLTPNVCNSALIADWLKMIEASEKCWIRRRGNESLKCYKGISKNKNPWQTRRNASWNLWCSTSVVSDTRKAYMISLERKEAKG